MDTHWHGDELHFSRPGVDGHIAVGADELHVHARLGLLLAPLRNAIEREIETHLERRFGA
jgi:putative polyhydroxyalkanoate system protein